MKVRTILFVVALAAANAFATPVQFTSVVRTNNDIAMIGSTADLQSDQSPPSSSPLITLATVFNDTDYADASSINGPGLLNTSVDAYSVTGYASGDAIAEFFGTFNRTFCLLTLELGFNVLPESLSTDPDGFSGAELFVEVVNAGTTVFSDVFTDSGLFDLNILLPSDGLTTLYVLLHSAASVINGGTAFNVADVTISASVPEPSTWMLIGLALVLAFRLTRKQPAPIAA